MDVIPEERSYYSSENEDSLSDWEQEIDFRGQVLFIRPSKGLENTKSPVNSSQTPTTTKTGKGVGKLSRLVQRRNSKKSVTALTTPLENGDYGQIKTFESFLEGTELLNISLKRPRNSSSSDIIESRLGIMIESGEDVIVSALVSEKESESQLVVGDWIRFINNVPVSNVNLRRILKNLDKGSKIQLRVQRQSQTINQLSSIDYSPNLKDNDDKINTISKFHIALYLTRSEDPSLQSDVLFQHPISSSSWQLFKVKGLFSTLATIIPELLHFTSSTPLVTTISIENNVIFVGTVEESSDILLIALPASQITLSNMTSLLSTTVSLLRFQYGSLRIAFTVRASELHVFFEDFFTEFLSASREKVQEILFFSPVLLHLPSDVKFNIDDALTQCESSDFQDLTDKPFDSPREFIILGSVIFHRGYLLASHLPKDDMNTIYSWLRFHKLLSLTKNSYMARIVVWQSVYPNESQGNVLLIVGLGFQLLALLLESDSQKSPNALIVQEALNTLFHLRDMGIPIVCERWLTLPPNPDILSVDKILASKGFLVSEPSRSRRIVLRRTKSVEIFSSSESESEESRCEEKSTAFRGEEQSLWRQEEEEKNNEQEEYVSYQVTQLSLSPQNTIFHYIHFDIGEGILLSPYTSPSESPLHQELLFNVHSAYGIIHESFSKTLIQNESLEGGSWNQRGFHSRFPIVEQGIFFSWTPIKKKPLDYWVSGRLFLTPTPFECFVCYSDSAPQLLIELAFRLAHGIHY